MARLFIISAPSGAGKTSLVHHILNEYNDSNRIMRVLTYTTRAQREGEVHGQDFYYISQEEFELKIAEGYFIEWSNAYGHYYGTPYTIEYKLAQGTSCILIADRAGARQIKKKIPEAVLIWIYTTNIEVLRKRLLARGTNTAEQISSRMALAAAELQEEAARPFYTYHVLNEDFYEAYTKLYHIVQGYLSKNG